MEMFRELRKDRIADKKEITGALEKISKTAVKSAKQAAKSAIKTESLRIQQLSRRRWPSGSLNRRLSWRFPNYLVICPFWSILVPIYVSYSEVHWLKQ